MRAILSKVAAVSMIAGAGLLVTACGGETANTTTTTTNTEVTTENVGASEDMTGMDNGTDAMSSNVTTTETTSNVTTGNVTN